MVFSLPRARRTHFTLLCQSCRALCSLVVLLVPQLQHLCVRMRRTQFEVSGFILLFALWYHALMDDAVIVPKPCPQMNKVCDVDSQPALLVNSTVTECLYVSDVLAQGLFGDFWDGFGGLPDSVVDFVVTRVSFHAAAMLLFYAFSLKCCDFMGGLGSFQLARGLALLAALICLRLVVARSGSWVHVFLFDFPESGKSACFGLGKDKVIPLCSPQMCVSILDPQVGGGLRAAAAFRGAARFFPRVFAAACAAASGALLSLFVVFVKWWDPLFLVSCMVLLGLFALSSVWYWIEESDEYIAAAASGCPIAFVVCYWCLVAVSRVLVVIFGAPCTSLI